MAVRSRGWCRCGFGVVLPSSLASDVAIAVVTIERISSKSGSPVLIFGGTKETVATGRLLAFSARLTNVSTSLAGIDVEMICLPA